MTKTEIKKIAIKADLPPGWYDGPWFDDDGNLRRGLPDCLVKFVEMVEAKSRRSR